MLRCTSEAGPGARSDNQCRTDSPISPTSRADRHRQRPVAVVTKADDHLPIYWVRIDPRRRLEYRRHVVDPAFRIAHVDVPGRRLALPHHAVCERVVDL